MKKDCISYKWLGTGCLLDIDTTIYCNDACEQYKRNPNAESVSANPLLSNVKRLRKDLGDEYILSLMQGIESNCEDDFMRKKVKNHIDMLLNSKSLLNEIIKRIAE